MKICISKTQIQNLIDVLDKQQKNDNSISDFIEIELVQENQTQLQSDRLKYSARSVYAECKNHFLGTN